MKKALIVFAREAIPGRVKTRLAASIGDHAAAELYDRMLQDVLETTRQLTDVESAVFWACEAQSLPFLAEKYRCSAHFQSEGDLGERMQAAFTAQFAAGADACCIIGSDAPDLPLSYLQEAFNMLEVEQADVVFGPSSDGGYYLLGMGRLYPPLFTDIPWSSSSVLKQSLAAARSAGLTISLLPEWHDVDTIEDLHALRERQRRTVA